jgi:hypothetical protein
MIPLLQCLDSYASFFNAERHELVPPPRASESSGLTGPSMESTNVQLLPNDLPNGVDIDAAAPARHSRGKRKPKLTNEGRAPPTQDRKRAKMHTTIPAPPKSPGTSASKTACLYPLTRTRPIHMAAAFVQGFGLDRKMLYTSTAPVHQTQRAPAQTSFKLVSILPHLQLPTVSKIVSQHALHPARKSSYERRHGGPRFTIYEDSTATHRQFLFGSDHPFFPWDLTPATTLQGSDNPQGDQENNYQRSQEFLALGWPNGQAGGLAATSRPDGMTVQRVAMQTKPDVSKQALDVLRMMR